MPDPAADLDPARTVLVCTDCGDAWEPDLTDPNGHTGCRSCGGWTWIGEIAEPRPARSTNPMTTATTSRDTETAELFGVPERVDAALDRLLGEQRRAARLLARGPKYRQLSALYEREARLWQLLALHTASRVYWRAATEAHSAARDRARDYAQLAAAWTQHGEPPSHTAGGA
jgi:hypothetical protein